MLLFLLNVHGTEGGSICLHHGDGRWLVMAATASMEGYDGLLGHCVLAAAIPASAIGGGTAAGCRPLRLIRAADRGTNPPPAGHRPPAAPVKKLCDICGCHNERELASYLAEERRPRACPLARLLRVCGQHQYQIKLPVCLSLGVAGRDTHALLMHLRHKQDSMSPRRDIVDKT